MNISFCNPISFQKKLIAQGGYIQNNESKPCLIYELECGKDRNYMNEVSMSDLKYFTNYRFIDIREKKDFLKEHIPGSTNIEMEELLINPDKYLNHHTTYIIYCDKGEASIKLCNILKKKYDVVSLKQGFIGYKLLHP